MAVIWTQCMIFPQYRPHYFYSAPAASGSVVIYAYRIAEVFWNSRRILFHFNFFQHSLCWHWHWNFHGSVKSVSIKKTAFWVSSSSQEHSCSMSASFYICNFRLLYFTNFLCIFFPRRNENVSTIGSRVLPALDSYQYRPSDSQPPAHPPAASSSSDSNIPTQSARSSLYTVHLSNILGNHNNTELSFYPTLLLFLFPFSG